MVYNWENMWLVGDVIIFGEIKLNLVYKDK